MPQTPDPNDPPNPNDPDKLEIRASYQLAFPVADVYAAWVSSDTVIPPAQRMEILPEVGGHYRLLMEGMSNEGTFVEVKPNQFLHYTWVWNQDGEESHIEVTFEPIHDSGHEHTHVKLFHYGFSKKDSVANHQQGWDSYIQGFTQYLEATNKPSN